jgi:hypothetical protein
VVSGKTIVNPLIFMKSKRLVISSEGFSALEKNTMICSQRAILPIQPAADSNDSLAHFFEFELAGSVVAG